MASVDSLIRLISFKGADALVIVTDEVPLLRKTGESIPLSMPRLTSDLVERFVEEVLSEEQRQELHTEGGVTTTYQLDGGERFTAKVESLPGGFKLVFRQGGSPGARAGGALAAPPREMSSPRRHDERVVEPRPTRPVESPTTATPAGEGRATPADTSFRSTLINFCIDAQGQEASDIFLSSGTSAHLRIGGVLREAPYIVCNDSQILEFLDPGMTPGHRAALDATGSVDFAFRHFGDDASLLLRVNLFKTDRGLAAALRPVERRIPTLEELGLPGSFRELVGFTSGLVLMTGQAGSGKSTTLAALIEHLNVTRPCHVITLEDPVEFRYEGKQCLIHQREVGRHVESFSSGLRAALRESPDVILLGELRDLATISSSLTAAETGHLVLSTLHCANAPMAVDRIVDIFPASQQSQIRFQLAGVLRAIVTQMLLPSLTPGRRVPAFEKLMVTDAVATKIRESRGHQLWTEIQTGREERMVTLERSLAALFQSGQIGLETALSAANDRDGLKRLLKSTTGSR